MRQALKILIQYKMIDLTWSRVINKIKNTDSDQFAKSIDAYETTSFEQMFDKLRPHADEQVEQLLQHIARLAD